MYSMLWFVIGVVVLLGWCAMNLLAALGIAPGGYRLKVWWVFAAMPDPWGARLGYGFNVIAGILVLGLITYARFMM